MDILKSTTEVSKRTASKGEGVGWPCLWTKPDHPPLHQAAEELRVGESSGLSRLVQAARRGHKGQRRWELAVALAG